MLILINAVTLLIDETHLIFVPLHYPPGLIIIHQGKGGGLSLHKNFCCTLVHIWPSLGIPLA